MEFHVSWLDHQTFVNIVKRIIEVWQDPVEELPTNATSLQDMTAKPGTIFAENDDPINDLEGWH